MLLHKTNREQRHNAVHLRKISAIVLRAEGVGFLLQLLFEARNREV